MIICPRSDVIVVAIPVMFVASLTHVAWSVNHEALMLMDTPPSYRHQCRLIPRDFALCYGIEYISMRLPNLLGHESISEVMEQASPWPPLVAKSCHPETRRFLCSLYAPVCLPGFYVSIPPCRSLCEGVRGACLPMMTRFGFSWPPMLNCSQFPASSDVDGLCIPGGSEVNVKDPEPCPPCDRKNAVTLRRRYCSFDFVMRVRVRRVDFDDGGTRILTRKRRKVFKWSSSGLRKGVLWLRDGLHCTCDVIKNIKSRYLVAGWQVGKNLILHSVARWSKKYKKLVRKKRSRKCNQNN